ncbi:MAG: cytochrome d ubiquinol oxidase subunit II [Helicobacteraceae bacterium]|nr:cytochrome d ubiquinol oxidase subunit II [Helicobacteraceae bacterium]
MFETFSLLALQEYWWFLISVIGAILVFMSFVFGGQSLIFELGSNENEKDLIVNSLGRKWELMFTTLVLFGGALFAAFPLFYATSFSGTLWVWIIILFSFILQAVSYEFRKKENNFLKQHGYELFLVVGGSVGLIFLGGAIASLFHGVAFSLNDQNLSFYHNSLRGLELLASPFILLFGVMFLFLARSNALLYFINNIKDQKLYVKSRKKLVVNALAFVVLYLVTLFFILYALNGYSSVDGKIVLESHHFFKSLVATPFLTLFPLLVGTVLYLSAIYITLFKSSKKGIWLSGAGTMLVGFSLLALLGFNGGSYYPSLVDMQSSLTIANSSSSHYTLTVMSYVSFLVPVIVAYVIYVWRILDRDGMSLEELEKGEKY